MKLKHVTNNVYYLTFYRKKHKNSCSISVLNVNMHDGQIKYTLDVILY